MVYKRANGEADATPPKLNLGNLVALQQIALTVVRTVLFAPGYIVFHRGGGDGVSRRAGG